MISMDDFGSSQSSLGCAEAIPARRAQGRPLVRERPRRRTPEDAAIVSAVISMAHALGLVAVADGVETREQFERAEGIRLRRRPGPVLRRQPRAASEAIAELLGASIERAIGAHAAPSDRRLVDALEPAGARGSGGTGSRRSRASRRARPDIRRSTRAPACARSSCRRSPPPRRHREDRDPRGDLAHVLVLADARPGSGSPGARSTSRSRKPSIRWPSRSRWSWTSRKYSCRSSSIRSKCPRASRSIAGVSGVTARLNSSTSRSIL